MRPLMTVLAVAVALPLSACGDRDPTDPTAAVSGSYSLRTINGETLPVIFDQSGANTAEILDGSITLHAAGTFADSITYRFTIDGEVDIQDDAVSGTWVQSRTAVILTPTGGDAYALAVTDNSLIQTFGAFALVYRK